MIIKRILLALLILLMGLAGWFFLSAYLAFRNDKDPDKIFLTPQLKLAIMEVNGLTKEKTDMFVKMLLTNPLPLGFTADSIRFRMFILEKEVMKSTYAKSLSLKAHDSSWISLPVTIFNTDLVHILDSSEKQGIDSVEYVLEATFFTDLILRREFNVRIKRTLPLFHIPEMKVERVEIDSLRVSGALLLLHISIKNENVFLLRFSDFSYKLDIGDNRWAEGHRKEPVTLRPKTTTVVTIPLKLNFKELGGTTFKILTEGKHLKYHVVVTLKPISEINTLKDSKFIMESDGEVKPLLKTLKDKN